MKKYVFLLLFVCSTAFAAEPLKDQTTVCDYFRLTQKEGKRQPLALETAVVKFTDAKKQIEVDLVAAVHVGDKGYYEELNELFKTYDSVLFELVADKDVKLDKKAVEKKKETSSLSGVQSGMGDVLDLAFQLEVVDYTASNFVHADLSPTEFAKRVAERGDLLQVLYRMMIHSLKKSGEGDENELKLQGRLLGTFFVSNTSLALKRLLAKEMVNQMDDSMWIISGDEGSAIISDRNAAALKVLRQRIKKGDKKVAIFYGGAHLPEFTKSLKNEFRLKPTEATWIIAWDLTRDKSARKTQ